MRALGPGSLSSFLKVILDVTYLLVLVAVAGIALMAFSAVLFSVNPALLEKVSVDLSTRMAARAPMVIARLLVVGAFMTAVLLIIGAQRRIFATLSAGDPFHPDNVGRLRFIGLILAGMELGRYLVWGVSAWLPWAQEVRPGFALTSWFAVLVVFVLAEVFREGARLRREAELTI